MGKIISQTLCFNIQNLPNHQLNKIVGLFTKICQNCPAGSVATILTPLLPKLIPFCVNRIDKCWAEKSVPDFDATNKKLPFYIWATIPDDCEIETCEIIYNRTLEDLTISFFDLIQIISQKINIPNPSQVNIFKDNQNQILENNKLLFDAFSNFFFTNEGSETLHSIVKSLCFTLVGETQKTDFNSFLKIWDEKSAFTKSLSVIENISAFLASHARFHILAHSLLSSLLLSITRRVNFEFKDSIIRSIYYLYSNLFKARVPPVQVFLNHSIPQEKINQINQLLG